MPVLIVVLPHTEKASWKTWPSIPNRKKFMPAFEQRKRKPSYVHYSAFSSPLPLAHPASWTMAWNSPLSNLSWNQSHFSWTALAAYPAYIEAWQGWIGDPFVCRSLCALADSNLLSLVLMQIHCQILSHYEDAIQNSAMGYNYMTPLNWAIGAVGGTNPMRLRGVLEVLSLMSG